MNSVERNRRQRLYLRQQGSILNTDAIGSCTLKTAVNYPFTLACWTKVANHPVAQGQHFLFGSIPAENDFSARLQFSATDNSFYAGCRTTGSSNAELTITAAEIDGIWLPMVGVFASAASRVVYAGSPSNSASNTTTRAITDFVYMSILSQPENTPQPVVGYMAEAALWNVALSAKEIAEYMAGRRADVVRTAGLQAYWPLTDPGLIQYDRSGNDNTLTLVGTVANAPLDGPPLI